MESLRSPHSRALGPEIFIMELLFIKDIEGEAFSFTTYFSESNIQKLFEFYCTKLSELYEINLLECPPVFVKMRNELNKGKDSYSQKINKNSYLISMRLPCNVNPFEVLFHELCHIFQMLVGFLMTDRENMMYIWKGQTFSVSDLEKMKYSKRPWEKEAMLYTYQYSDVSKYLSK
jgi:hypothetical protein